MSFKEGDTVFDINCPNMEQHLQKGLGKGIVTKVFSNGLFTVKYDNKTLDVMHSSSGMRYDREGFSGAKRVQRLDEIKDTSLF